MTTERTPEEIVHILSVTDLLEVAEDICRDHGVRLSDVTTRVRFKSISAARQAIWYAMKHHPDRHYSDCDIARAWGRCPDVVLKGCRQHKKRTGGALPKSWHRVSEGVMCIAGGW